MESQQQSATDDRVFFPPRTNNTISLSIPHLPDQQQQVVTAQQTPSHTQPGVSSNAPVSSSVFVSLPVSSVPSATPSSSAVPINKKLDTFWQNQYTAIQNITEDHWRTPEFPLARIKKIMRMDEDVRMISAEVPVMFSKAVEVFIAELTMRAWQHTEDSKRKTIQRSDIAMAITKNDMYDFLIDIVPREEIQVKAHTHKSVLGESLQLLPPDLLQLYVQHLTTSNEGNEGSSTTQNQLQILQQLLQIQQLQQEHDQAQLNRPTDPLPPTGSVLDTQVLQTSDTQEISSDLLHQLRHQMSTSDYSMLSRDTQLMVTTSEGLTPSTDIHSLSNTVLDQPPDTTIVQLPAEFGLDEGSPDETGAGGGIEAFGSTPLTLTHRTTN